MIKSRSKFLVYAKVARAEPEGKSFDDTRAGRPVERRLNRIERVAAGRHAQIASRSGESLLASFDSADGALLAACEMQRRCAVLPQILSLKLVLRIGIHQGMILQRSQDADDNGAGIAIRLARLDDGIAVSGDLLDSLGEGLRRFARPLGEPAADLRVFVIDWSGIPSGTCSGDSALLSQKRARTDCLLLQLGMKTLELSKDKPVATIGRDPESDFVLTDIHASRNHCRIEYSEKDALLTDSSTNGTMIVTENKQEVLVKNGSVALSGKGMIFFGRPFMGERRGGILYELS